MTTHQMKLEGGPFEKIAGGKKVIEARIYDEKRRKINTGDQIEFTCNDDPTRRVLVKVETLYHYSSFKDLFSDFPPEDFGGTSKEELIEEISKFYSEEEVQRYGVVGIRIELL